MQADQLVDVLTQQWPCRDAQIQQLSALLTPARPSPPVILLHGTTSTGKSAIIEAYLTASELPYALVPCQEAITERHLFERTLALVTRATTPGANVTSSETTKCENASNLQSSLLRLLKEEDKFILVLDGIDELEDRSATLLPALSRMHEKIRSLVLVLITKASPPGLLRQHGIQKIHFPPYSRDQSIHIVSQKPLDIFLDLEPSSRYTASSHQEDKSWLWPRYVAAVWDSLGQSAARSLGYFHDTCNKLWQPFLIPIIKGDLGTRDFSRLMVSQRTLFQDESVLLEAILDQSTEDTAIINTDLQHDIPFYAQWVLVAAFLTAMNPPRTDAIFFMKSTDRKRRKKGASTMKSAQQRKAPRHLFQPAPFTLERLVAIFQAILPDQLRGSIDLHTQLATLKSLRFLVQSGGFGTGDVLEGGSKWKVGSTVTFELVSHISGLLDFSLGDYLAA